MTSYQPVVPAGGLLGWRFLSRTMEAQKAVHDGTAVMQRDAASFREKIGSVKNAADLVADRQLLSVALTAFGLQDDLPNRYFIRQVLEGDPSDRESLAGRLSDPRYAALSETFGFGSGTGPRTAEAGFADRILNQFTARSFEEAVGQTAPELRLALSLERELGSIVETKSSNNAQWFAIMGMPPLREVFETAFSLPPSFGSLDIDRQLDVLKTKSAAMFGTDQVADLAVTEKTEDLRRHYLLRAEAASTVARSPALQLLQGDTGAGGILSVLYGA